MERFSLDGVTAAIYFDTRRAKNTPVSDEKDIVFYELRYPVKYRIFFNGRYYFHSSGIDLTKDEWKEMPNTRKRELIDTRALIQAGFEKIKALIKELTKGEGFSPDAFNRRLSRGNDNSVITAFLNKIETLTAAGQIGTASSYQCSLNSILNFTGRKDLKFADVTVNWLEKYESDLLKEVTIKGETRQRSITTAKFYIGCIRQL